MGQVPQQIRLATSITVFISLHKMNLESLPDKGWQLAAIYGIIRFFSMLYLFFISIFMKLVKTLIFKLLFSFVTYKLTNFHSILSFCHF